MGSQADGVVGRIQDKARALKDGLIGDDGTVGDEHPDIEYEPAPEQEVMHDGMVVLGKEQMQKAEGQQRDGGEGEPEG